MKTDNEVAIEVLKDLCLKLVESSLHEESMEVYFKNTRMVSTLIEVLAFLGEECSFHQFKAKALGLSMEEYNEKMGFNDPPLFAY